MPEHLIKRLLGRRGGYRNGWRPGNGLSAFCTQGHGGGVRLLNYASQIGQAVRCAHSDVRCSAAFCARLRHDCSNATPHQSPLNSSLEAQSDMEEEPRYVECPEHGEQQAAYVCQHPAHTRRTGKRTGFWCPEDTGNPRPDAWCDECEKMIRDRIDPDRDLGHSDRM